MNWWLLLGYTYQIVFNFSRKRKHVKCKGQLLVLPVSLDYWLLYLIFYIGLPYPLKTPRTKLSMKNDPITISGMKNTQLKALPRASFVCKSFSSFKTWYLKMLTSDSPSTLLVSIPPWSHIERWSALPARCCQRMLFLKYSQFYDHYRRARRTHTHIHLYWARPISPDILTHYAWYNDMQ